MSEQKITNTFSKMRDTLTEYTKVVRPGGKLRKAIDEIGGDSAFLNDVKVALDDLFVAIDEAEMAATSQLKSNESFELDEAGETPDTYARVIYDYSEDFGMITLYDNGNKIDEWSGYFGADTVGNPLADKFVEIAKKNGLNPEGMSIVDDEGEKGTFEDNTFNWDQFANDATGMNEEPNEGNEFSGALAQAKKSGKSEFEVDGKRFKVKEAAKPDFLDMDKDGDKKEPMKKALKDKEKVSESIELTNLKVLAGL